MFRFDYSASFLRWCGAARRCPPRRLACAPAEATRPLRDRACPAAFRRALQPPGWLRSWHPAVRVTATKKLVAFISAVPADVQIYSQYGRGPRPRGASAPH